MAPQPIIILKWCYYADENQLQDKEIPLTTSKVDNFEKGDVPKSSDPPPNETPYKQRPGRPEKLMKKRKDKKMFTCNLCKNVYQQKSELSSHMAAHLNYKPHQCEICFKSFRQMGELREHIRRHTGERPYKCLYCDRRFYDRSEKSRHERMHTNTRPYACKDCGKTFTHSAILKNHRILHSGIKNFKCSICEKSFTLLHQLKAHLQTMTHRGKEKLALASTSEYLYDQA